MLEKGAFQRIPLGFSTGTGCFLIGEVLDEAISNNNKMSKLRRSVGWFPCPKLTLRGVVLAQSTAGVVYVRDIDLLNRDAPETYDFFPVGHH